MNGDPSQKAIDLWFIFPSGGNRFSQGEFQLRLPPPIIETYFA